MKCIEWNSSWQLKKVGTESKVCICQALVLQLQSFLCCPCYSKALLTLHSFVVYSKLFCVCWLVGCGRDRCDQTTNSTASQFSCQHIHLLGPLLISWHCNDIHSLMVNCEDRLCVSAGKMLNYLE